MDRHLDPHGQPEHGYLLGHCGATDVFLGEEEGGQIQTGVWRSVSS